MWRFKSLSVIFSALMLLMTTSCFAEKSLPLKSGSYVITSEEDAKSERWAEYLFYHLSKRTDSKTSVILKKGSPDTDVPAGVKNIHFEVAPDLKNDYCIKHTMSLLHIRVRSENTALWIIYQLINRIADEDYRFVATDLPPAIISFDSQCRSFDFTYREPYFAPNIQPDYAPLIGTNNVEMDWGLWGHNLFKIVKNAKTEEIYALIDGERNKAQLSFSSPELFEIISSYIIDNYGVGEKQAYCFMIMPEDNSLVCTCPSCKKLGNTPSNATPAVIDLLCRLAKRFQRHTFFTTAYRTVSVPPACKLPENTGVFFSTINLPKGIALDPRQALTSRFIGQLKAWKEKTSNVYLWDYAANFDDYLTPIPVLLSMQKQLRFFKEQQVNGIFINGSGYDYSPFDDMKTFVAGALMMDIDSDVGRLCKDFFRKEYPVSYQLLSDYYLSQEQMFLSSNKAYDMYGGMRQNMTSYLHAAGFIHFYDRLVTIISKVGEEERKKLQKLLTALSYTRLQIAYTKGYNEGGYAEKRGDSIKVKPYVSKILKTLENYTAFPNMQAYKETDGLLSSYIAEWKQLIADSVKVNKLMNQSIEILSNTDEGFETADLLHDGSTGFGTDYHQGWYLSSMDNLHLRFSAQDLQQAKGFRICFLNDMRHSIFPPEKVKVYIDGKPVQDIVPAQTADKGSRIVECNIGFTAGKARNIELKFIRKQAPKSIVACDEIIVLE